MAFPFIIVAHLRITSGTARTLQKLANDGTQQWSADHGADCYSVAADDDGNIYVGGNISSGYTVRRYDPDGNLDWSADTAYSSGNYTVYGLVVGGGYVYTAQKATAFFGDSARDTVFKLDAADGSEEWASDTFDHAYGVAVKSNDRVWAVTEDSRHLYQFNSSGVRDWRISDYDELYCITRIDDEYFIVGGKRDSNETHWKLRSQNNGTPSEIWAADHGDDVHACAVDGDGNVYIGGERTGNYTTRKYNSSGTLQWSADHGDTVYAIAVDSDGDVYTGGVASGGYEIRKLDGSDGSTLNSIAIGATVRALALVVPGSIETDAPAAALPLRLALPICTVSVAVTALALPLRLALPTVQGTPAAPDLSSLAGPYRQVYRLYLASTDTPIELPLGSLQCRRRLGASTWLTVEVPTYSEAILASCEANLESDILVHAGLDDGSGEQLGEFLRATLTEITHFHGARSAGITLTARVQTPSYTQQSRTLIDVRRRGIEAGRHTARCAVDPLLRPNDEADDGEETWTVGSILYQIGPHAAWMDVAEVSSG